MARPNNGKTQERLKYPRLIVHPDLNKLLKAFRLHLIADGHPEAIDMSLADISKFFTEHYLSQTYGSSAMGRVKKYFKAVIPEPL